MGLTDIRDHELAWIQSVAASHGRDHRGAGSMAAGDDVQFGRDRINGIDHVVVGAEIHMIPQAGQVEHRVGVDQDSGIDGQHPLPRDFHLGPSDRVLRSQDLTVDVGEIDLVIVHDVQGADAAASQCLQSVTANTANTKQEYTAAGQACDRFRPQQAGRSLKSLVHSLPPLLIVL